MGKKRVLYGVSNFKEFRQKSGYFLDKTQYIEELEYYQNIIFLRPRRFGKSFLCSVLHHYYDVQHKDDFEFLFGDTTIGKNPTPFKNQYMVLHLNFSVIEVKPDADYIEDSFNNHCNGVMEVLIKEYQEYFDDPHFLSKEVSACKNFENLLRQIQLSKAPPLYIIIDEYDNFCNQLIIRREDSLYRYITTGSSFLRTFLKIIKAGRESGTIANSFITGVLPITMDDVTSAYNIGTFLTLRKGFASMLGYTEDEVTQWLHRIYEDHDIPEDSFAEVQAIVKNHYNGYRFVDSSPDKLYNPTILSYFLQALVHEEELPSSLIDENLKTDISWVRRLTSNREENIQDLMNELILNRELAYDGQYLKDKFNMTQFFQKEYYPISFFYLGMLSKKENSMRMRIPNNNMLAIMTEYFNEVYKIDISTKYADMMEGFLRTSDLPKLFSDYWELYISQFPEAVFQQVNENFYRTTFFELCSRHISPWFTWNLERSYPSGKSDLEFVGKFDSDHAHERHVIEFKYFSNKEFKKLKTSVSKFKLNPDDAKQIAGYCDSLRKEYPQASIRQYVIYCFGNIGFRVFTI